MGHEFARPIAAAALILIVAACGDGSGDGEPPAILENAREQVDSDSTSVASSDDETDDAAAAGAGSVASDELPLPDPSTFEGANRVVNLWVGADGETLTVDVWGRRTFTNGPILLAENVAFGTASGYFSAPPGYSLVVVGAGAGPDGEERAAMFNAGTGEQITTIFTNDDDRGTVNAPNLFERGRPESPESPLPDRGLVWLVAPNVRSFSEQLIESIGGDAFYVGDGTGVCRVQRREADGVAPSVLGGTQSVELELPAGPAVVTLHPWFSPDECDQPTTVEIAVDVEAGASVMIIVFSSDGATVDSITIPVRPPT